MMELLLYCTKAKPYLQVNRCVLPTEYDRYILSKEQCYSGFGEPLDKLNGKIVAECDFEVEEISRIKSWNSTEDYDWEYGTPTLCYYDLLRKSCLMCDEFEEYIEFSGYAIHIKNLHIFDKPINIKNYYNIAPRTMQDCMNQRVLVKAPQNMMYAFDCYGNPFVLISIRPEWLYKILNGEKTIEVRKKVLKEMLK